MELIDEIKDDADVRMGKSLEALHEAFARIRTGRAHPSLLNSVRVPYYGADTQIEKAILRSGLGLTPAASADVVRSGSRRREVRRETATAAARQSGPAGLRSRGNA